MPKSRTNVKQTAPREKLAVQRGENFSITTRLQLQMKRRHPEKAEVHQHTTPPKSCVCGALSNQLLQHLRRSFLQPGPMFKIWIFIGLSGSDVCALWLNCCFSALISDCIEQTYRIFNSELFFEWWIIWLLLLGLNELTFFSFPWLMGEINFTFRSIFTKKICWIFFIFPDVFILLSIRVGMKSLGKI